MLKNEEKNRILKKDRNISFEEIVLAIENEKLMDILEHHDSEKYPNQFLLIVEIQNYSYVVEDDDAYFLKTIYPSRKATNNYLR